MFTANEIKDDRWALLIATKLAQGGIPLRYFSKFKKKKWYKKFESDFPIYVEHYKINFDEVMRNRFLEILQVDYETTEKYHSWRERKIELTLQELIDGATNVLTNFTDFNDKYGFPNEENMGYNYIRRKNRIEPYKIDVLMIHLYQTGTSIFKDNIHNLVCQGSLNLAFEQNIKKIQGFGDGTGIQQEMKARFEKYRGTE